MWMEILKHVGYVGGVVVVVLFIALSMFVPRW